MFDIGSRIVDHPALLYQGSEWLIVIGVIGALVATVFGFLDVLTIPRGTKVFRTGLLHTALNVAVLVAAFEG